MLLIPLRTDTPIRRTPLANYALLAMNGLIFLLTYDLTAARQPGVDPIRHSFAGLELMLNGADPRVYQLVTYQFLHDGWQHLLGNMLFLWVFGNSVNAKMGQAAYVLFYLSCGVLAGAGYLLVNDAVLLGASGSIAGVTTAFLVLFPRSRISFFYWFFFIGYFELPSMILIVGKIIVYDNIIAPAIGGAAGIAYSAHIAGYAAGLAISILLLAVRALPRDPFDLLALWKRAYQRRAFASAVQSDPMAEAKHRYGRMAREPAETRDKNGPTEDDLDRATEIRGRIAESIRGNDLAEAARQYVELIQAVPDQVLPKQQQLDIANALASSHDYENAAEAYEKYLRHYPSGEQHAQVQLMLGIICAKHLKDHDRARRHLQACRDGLSDSRLVAQCDDWLASIDPESRGEASGPS